MWSTQAPPHAAGGSKTFPHIFAWFTSSPSALHVVSCGRTAKWFPALLLRLLFGLPSLQGSRCIQCDVQWSSNDVQSILA